MNIDFNENDFRDRMITEILIGYGWDNGSHFAKISLADNEGIINSFLIKGLSEYDLCDDFSSAWIERCKLIISENEVFLCLDPYDEFNSTQDLEKDYFWFKGKSIDRA